ncbi:hypothetical protein FGIG_11426 [Fasciola gigantica]|uniref:Uncharacterized protein n=1 Tax=Fasciola gigantica TaxID=46835 RepID=A0A504YRW9_FASGI|nr:hypothetical protein FGIG_11426 [Fasciola gigantica]
MSDQIEVRWRRISVLDADLSCVRILLNRALNYWTYWTNLSGQEFPKNNEEVNYRQLQASCVSRFTSPFNGSESKSETEQNDGEVDDENDNEDDDDDDWDDDDDDDHHHHIGDDSFDLNYE